MPPPLPSACSANLQPSEVSLEHFVVNGVPAIPVVFLPAADFAIRLKNTKLVLDNLQQVTSHSQEATEVTLFGKNDCFQITQSVLRESFAGMHELCWRLSVAFHTPVTWLA